MFSPLTPPCPPLRAHSLALAATLIAPLAAWSATEPACLAVSGPQRVPVIELYTSEGCSSCPPADQWLSRLRGQPVVAQAFHVAYWDYIGWKDRFASPLHEQRQRALARADGSGGVYTPQVRRDGLDWPAWRHQPLASQRPAAARASIELRRVEGAQRFEARVRPGPGVTGWTAYWTVTEDAHGSQVRAGENDGAYLQHDFVVRQYVPLSRPQQGEQTLTLHAWPAQPQHPRRINLVVSAVESGEPLQALSLACP